MLNEIKSFANYHVKYGFLFKKKLKKIIELRKLDNNKLLEIQNEKLLKAFRHAIKHSRFYKKLYADYGISAKDVQSVLDMEKLPIITKSDVRDHIDDIYIGPPFFKAKGYTSGTSGSPLILYRTYDSVLEEAAFIWAQRFYFGYLPGMRTVSLRGDLGRDEMMRYDKFTNTLYLSSYNISQKNAEWYLKKIQDFSPYTILAYPSSLENLANLFYGIGKEVQIPLAFTSSETLYDTQRTKIENVFNTKVYDWYGNAERTIAIEQRLDDQYYELPLYSFNEFQDDCTITTGLINLNFPLIRYQVTDIIRHADYMSDHDKRRFKIDTISGRNDDVLMLPDGTKVGRLDVVLKGIDNVEYAQFIQKEKNSFLLNLVVRDSFSDKDKAKIVKNLEYRIGKGISYKINEVRHEDIIYARSGKFKLVINEL